MNLRNLNIKAVAGLLLSSVLWGQAQPPAPTAPAQAGSMAKPVQATPVQPVDGGKAAVEKTAGAEKVKIYVVKKGDTLAAISRETGIPLARLSAWNPALAKRGLWEGDKVSLDGPSTEKSPRGRRSIPAAPAPVEVAPVIQVVARAHEEPRAEAPRAKKAILPEPEEDQEAVVREMKFVKEIIYNPDAVPEVNCHVRTVHTITLPDSEAIVNVQTGDNKLWGIVPIIGRNVVFVKPVLPQKATNLVVATKVGNLYSFRLVSDMSRPPLYTLRVLPPETDEESLNPGRSSSEDGAMGQGGPQGMGGGSVGDVPEGARYTQDDLNAAAINARNATLEEAAKAVKERERSFAASLVRDRNDDYKISYDWGTPFRVKTIFDAGGLTWIRVDAPEGRTPVLWVVGDQGNREIANQKVDEHDSNLIIVDQPFRKAVLVLGKKEAIIINSGLEKRIAKIKGKK